MIILISKTNYFFLHKIHSDFWTTRSTTYLQIIFFEHAVMKVHFLVHLTHKTEFLVFPSVQPAATPFEHNTTFTWSQNLQTPVAALPLCLSHTCFGLLVCRCSLVQFGFPQPFLERCQVLRHRLFSRGVTVLERRYGRHNTSAALSTFTVNQTAFPRQNDFFCREIKRDASAEGISVVL